MARLKVRLRGKVVSEVTLQEDKVFMAGRKEDCEILLQPEKGVSREHFQLAFNEGRWELKVLSRFGDVLVGGEKVASLVLEDSQIFSVPPYEFEYISASAPVVAAPVSEFPVEAPAESISASFEGGDNSDKTVVGGGTFIPLLKILDEFKTSKRTFDLAAGDTFLAGREPSCQIHIDDQRVSRRQFEIKKVNNTYFITDLGSVNGTYVNGQVLPQNEPMPLKSGDMITVLDNQMAFELHDPNFHKIVGDSKALAPVEQNMPAPQQNWAPMVANPQQGAYPVGPYHGGMYPHPAPIPQAAAQDNKKKIFRMAIAGIAAVLLLAFLFNNDDSGTKKPASAVKPNDPLAKLDANQKMMVKHHYQLSENYLAQQKWMLAKGEIEKIKQLLGDNYKTYERTFELEMNAEQGLNSEREILEIEQREQRLALQEQKIQEQVEICKKKVNPKVTKQEIEDCLQPVLQFNPEHAQIQALRGQVDQIITQRQLDEAHAKELDKMAAQLRNLFENAEHHEKTQNYLDALKVYEKVQKASLPDRGNYKTKATRQIAAIKNKMNTETSALMSNADKMAHEQQYKQAILALRDAKKIDPTNTAVDEKIDFYTKELRKIMQVYFQEGVLEEGFGNIEGNSERPGAKDKWKKILELDIPDGEYYIKAKQRLRKYGVI